MIGVFKYGLVLAAVALGLYAMLVVGMRLRGPTAEQAVALKVLNEPVAPVRGRDGSDAVWLLPFDTPEHERTEAARRLRDYLARSSVLAGTGRQEEADRLADPSRDFATFAPIDSKTPGLCPEFGADCLRLVREQRQVVDQVLTEHAAGLRAARRLADYDGLRWGLEPSLHAAMPQFAPQRLLVRTHYARMFDLGGQEAAIAGVCRDLWAWRRLGSDNDMVLASVVASSYARSDLRLLSEMLAEWPADAGLPPDCAGALAPVQARELDLCPGIRTHYAAMAREFRFQPPPAGEDGLVHRWMDREHAAAALAPSFAHYCGADVLRLQQQDRSATQLGPPPAICGSLERVADPFGCALAGLGVDERLSRYVDRRTDSAAAIALMRTVVWLRAQSPDPSSWSALLPKRPASLGLKREPKISADGARISIALLDRSRDAEFSLVLRPAPQAMNEGAGSPSAGDGGSSARNR
ncbi:hypothetical protein [Arenimonas sp.]|uniref:hypothetical protein n=1 Tax=Arenimonas sp. TaxID=1872635 RepID=UPI0039E64D27